MSLHAVWRLLKLAFPANPLFQHNCWKSLAPPKSRGTDILTTPNMGDQTCIVLQSYTQSFIFYTFVNFTDNHETRVYPLPHYFPLSPQRCRPREFATVFQLRCLCAHRRHTGTGQIAYHAFADFDRISERHTSQAILLQETVSLIYQHNQCNHVNTI